MFGLKYSDNPKYFYEYVLAEEPRIRAIWITKNHDVYEVLLEKGVEVYMAYSMYGLYHQLTSLCFVSSVNSRDFAVGTSSPKNYYLQLWHGAPIKHIGADVKVRFHEKFLNVARSKLTDNYSLIISPYAYFSGFFQSAFPLQKEKVYVAKYPRCDHLNIEDKKKSEVSDFIMLVAPTHRDEGKSSGARNVSILRQLVAQSHWFELNNVKVIFKPHFYESKYFKQELLTDRVIVDFDTDINMLFEGVDGLITDYSSVCFDFHYTGKPIVFLQDDLDVYIREQRDLYFSLNEIACNISYSLEEAIQSVLISVGNLNFKDGFEISKVSGGSKSIFEKVAEDIGL